MIVVDAHQDIAYNAVVYGRDYKRNTLETRKLDANKGIPPATLGLPEAILGRVGVAFTTLFVAPRTSAMEASPLQSVAYDTPREAYEKAMVQLDVYKRLQDETNKIRLIHNRADLDAVLATWEPDTEISDHQQGFVILMEGADPIIEPQQFEEWFEYGVRIVGPAWTQTRYAGGTGAQGPLTKLGYELLDVMADKKAVLDLSHLAEQAFLQAVDHYDGPIIASHSNPRRFCPTDRHLTNQMIRALAERDGVMGVVLYNAFINKDWKIGDFKYEVPISMVADIIDYVCQLTGSSAHVGIGSDFDGGFGVNAIPDGMDNISDLLMIGESLRERGYEEADVSAILGGNMLRKLTECLDNV